LGLREETIVIFLSDHGHSVEERTFFGGGSSGPYRGHKFTLWEGGIRVPCIVSWPGKIPENEVREQFTVSADWLPTVAEYCGARKPKWGIDGKSLVKVIADADASSSHKVFHWDRGGHWAVREGDWKLVHNGPSTKEKEGEIPKVEWFLSNLAEDATERVNLAEKHQEVVQRLTALHEKWVSSCYGKQSR